MKCANIIKIKCLLCHFIIVVFVFILCVVCRRLALSLCFPALITASVFYKVYSEATYKNLQFLNNANMIMVTLVEFDYPV